MTTDIDHLLYSNENVGWKIPDYISFEYGRKNTYGTDIVLLLYGRRVNMSDIGFICWFLCNNEARIWPLPKFQGPHKFQGFIAECITSRTFTKGLLKKYHL